MKFLSHISSLKLIENSEDNIGEIPKILGCRKILLQIKDPQNSVGI